MDSLALFKMEIIQVIWPMLTLSRSKIAGVVATAFGLLTILSGGSALFGGPEARAAAGNAVPFVLWFNFFAGFAYILAGLAIMLRHKIGYPLAFAIAGTTILIFGALLVHVVMGGAYEMRTLVAMIFRTAVWLAISIAIRPTAHDAGPA